MQYDWKVLKVLFDLKIQCMDLKIKNTNGVSTMTYKADFNVILNENFAAVCDVIAIRGRVLKELINAFEGKNAEMFKQLCQITEDACGIEEAISGIKDKMGLSRDAALFLLNWNMEDLEKMNSKYFKKDLNQLQALLI